MVARGDVTLLAEPRGADHVALLRFAASRSTTLQLILRSSLRRAASCDAVLGALEPHLVARGRTRRWPGTRLVGRGRSADYLRYAPTPAVLEIVAAAAPGLYAWTQAALPEDPCFLRADGTPVLATIAHEQDAFLRLEAAELADLRAALGPSAERLLGAV